MCFYSIDYKAIPENIGLLFPNRLAKIDSNSPPYRKYFEYVFNYGNVSFFGKNVHTHGLPSRTM